MNIQTKFCCGDKAWAIGWSESRGRFLFCGTIGQIRVEVTDSPGIPGETIFDNYKATKKRVESYMLVETGIESGIVYTLGEHIFETKLECEAAIAAAKAAFNPSAPPH